MDKIPHSLKKYSAKKIGKNTITITYKTSRVSIEDIFLELKKENLTLRDISTQDADLEDIFKHLVGNRNKKTKVA